MSFLKNMSVSDISVRLGVRVVVLYVICFCSLSLGVPTLFIQSYFDHYFKWRLLR